MTFGSSVLLLVLVIAAIGLLALAVAWFAPRKKGRASRKQDPKQLRDPISDPPTITHYGHA